MISPRWLISSLQIYLVRRLISLILERNNSSEWCQGARVKMRSFTYSVRCSNLGFLPEDWKYPTDCASKARTAVVGCSFGMQRQSSLSTRKYRSWEFFKSKIFTCLNLVLRTFTILEVLTISSMRTGMTMIRAAWAYILIEFLLCKVQIGTRVLIRREGQDVRKNGIFRENGLMWCTMKH